MEKNQATHKNHYLHPHNSTKVESVHPSTPFPISIASPSASTFASVAVVVDSNINNNHTNIITTKFTESLVSDNTTRWMKRSRQEDDNINNEKNSPLKLIRIPEWRDAVAGGFAGAVSKTAMAPVERVKLLLQLQSATTSTVSSSSSATTGATNKSVITGNTAWSVARDIYRHEGVLAFWRGNWSNVMRTAGQAALNLALMDYYKEVASSSSPIIFQQISFTRRGTNNNDPLSHAEIERRRKLIVSFLSGGMAGGTATTVLYPIEYLRTRLAMDQGRSSSQSRQYRGMKDVVVKTFQADGIRGLYQGYGIALWGSVLYRLLFLGGYDVVKRELQTSKMNKTSSGDASTTNAKSMNFAERFFLAQLVSLTAGTICYPIDSVRRRLMMQAGKPVEERPYRNSMQCFRVVWAKEGIRGFYLGLAPNLVRSVGGALMLVAYDTLKELL